MHLGSRRAGGIDPEAGQDSSDDGVFTDLPPLEGV